MARLLNEGPQNELRKCKCTSVLPALTCASVFPAHTTALLQLGSLVLPPAALPSELTALEHGRRRSVGS